MKHSIPSLAKDLLYNLHSAGLVITGPDANMGKIEFNEQKDTEQSPRVFLKALDPQNDSQLRQVLSETGYVLDTGTPGEIIVVDRKCQQEIMLSFSIPVRLPTLNPQLRTHWYRKSKQIKSLCWEVFVAVPPKLRPREPLENITIEIDRYNTNEPDDDNLMASAKWLLDVLQPMHPTARPYGLSIIREDAKWCVHDLDVRHIPSAKKRTDVRIYKSQQPPRRKQS